MGLKINVGIAALILCGAMIGCGPSQAELKAQKLKAQKTAQAIAQAMGTEEQRKGWDTEDPNPWWNADQAIQKLGYAECPEQLNFQGQHSTDFAPPFYPNIDWKSGRDKNGNAPSEAWMACYQTFLDAQHKLDAERQAKREVRWEAEKAKKAAQEKAEADFRASNPEEDVPYLSAYNAVFAKDDACRAKAEELGGHSPEEYKNGGYEAQEAAKSRCYETWHAELDAVEAKYPHSYARELYANRGSGVTLDQLFRKAHNVLHEDDDDPCAVTGYICK